MSEARESTVDQLLRIDMGREITVCGFDLPALAHGRLAGVERTGARRRLLTLEDNTGRWSIGCPPYQRVIVR